MSFNKRIFQVPVVTIAIVVLAGSIPTASAFVPVGGDDTYEIPLKQFDLAGYHSPAVELAKDEAAASFADRNGGNWRVYTWNPQTGTPSNLYGSGVELATGLTSGNEAAELARQVIAANPAVFGADLENLRLVATPYGMGKWAVHFQQTYEGLDVWGGGVHLTFTEQGRLFVMGSEYYRGIDLNPVPALPLEAAERIALLDLPFNPVTDWVADGASLLVLPEPLSETQVVHHLVWRLRVHTADPIGIWVTHVDAHSGEIVWRYNDVHFVDFEGDAKGDIEPDTYCLGIEEQDLKYLRVEVDGVGTTTTDQNGNWSIPYGGTDPHLVVVDLYGPCIDINNQGGDEAEFSEMATPGVPMPVRFDDLNAQRDERDCFDAVNDIHDFIGLFDPDFGYIHQRILCNVSLDQTCNAYWNGTINFFREGDGCANTGQIQGVVHHEFGHGIQDFILGWQGSQGLGEGNSDIVLNLLTQDSVVGRGFYLNVCDSGIRNSLNTLRYPEDVIGQPIHYAGQVIAGFHWDFMVLMQGVYGQETGKVTAGKRWHFCRVLEHPTTQPAQVLATFIVDDDDGNLDNGTPHYDYLCEAAMNHGFECPEILVGVIIEHTPVPSRTEEGDVEIVATIHSTEAPLVPEDLLLTYRVNGSEFVDEVLTPTGGTDEYHAFIPDLTQPSEVEYYLQGRDELNNYRTHPPLAPDALHAFDIALVLDDLEVDTGWIVNLEGLDDATTGHWVREDPVGTAAQPEDDHTVDPGVVCWVTGNAAPGSGIGTNDVDDGSTSVYTPVYDLTGATFARVKFWRWYSNTRGSDPLNDIWVVQVRNNGGGWMDVERNQDDQDRWVFKGADLQAIFGDDIGNVQLKFIASDLNDGSIVEAAVDDFEVLALLDAADLTEEDGGQLRYALHGGGANPVTGPTEIAFQVPAEVRAQLAVYDVSGRMVRMLANEAFGPGLHTLTWDGNDAGGQPVASGVYYCRMQAAEFNATRTLVVSR